MGQKKLIRTSTKAKKIFENFFSSQMKIQETLRKNFSEFFVQESLLKQLLERFQEFVRRFFACSDWFCPTLYCPALYTPRCSRIEGMDKLKG